MKHEDVVGIFSRLNYRQVKMVSGRKQPAMQMSSENQEISTRQGCQAMGHELSRQLRRVLESSRNLGS